MIHGRRNGRGRIWLRATPDGSLHTLEHEADYDGGDTLIMVSTTQQGVKVEIIHTQPEQQKDN